MIDIHAHILPGVDDGSRNWTETQALLNMAWQQGIHHIIATPHFSRDADVKHLQALCAQAGMLAKKVNQELAVALGQEILYFEGLPEYLEQGRALTLAGSRYVLVEFKPSDEYSRLYRAVRALLQTGWFPVVAHVERYGCLRKKGRTEQLIQSGAYLQVNARSLEGSLLDRTAAWCRREILEGNVHFLATDMHHPDQRPPQVEKAEAWLERHLEEAVVKQLLEVHPECILENRMI